MVASCLEALSLRRTHQVEKYMRLVSHETFSTGVLNLAYAPAEVEENGTH